MAWIVDAEIYAREADRGDQRADTRDGRPPHTRRLLGEQHERKGQAGRARKRRVAQGKARMKRRLQQLHRWPHLSCTLRAPHRGWQRQ